MSDSNASIRFTEEEIDVPLVDLLTGRGFITGKSGSGKSNTAGKICEEILEEGYPLMVIDTEGEYYGLKEEYELLHVGADEECDLQVGPEHAGKIAELALEENVPIILDVSGYIETSEVNQLVHDTCKAMFDKEKKLKKPFPILVEEAHEWIPQQGTRGEDGEVTKMLIRIGKRGRKRGLGLAALSQRPQAVDKDYITQTDYKIWHHLDWDTELKVVKRVLGKDWVEDVSNLETGEAILQADFIENSPRKVHVLEKKTFDAGKLADRLAQVASGGEEGSEALDEIREEKNDRIRELESKKDELESELEEVKSDKQDLKQRVEELEEYEQAQENMEELREAYQRMGEALDLEPQGSQDKKLKKKLKQKDNRIDEMRKRLQEAKNYDSSEFIGSSRYDNLANNIASRESVRKKNIDTIMNELDRGSKSLTQLSHATGLAKRTVREQYLNNLKKQDWITKSGDKYKLASEIR